MRIKIALRNLFISQLIICVFLVFAYFIWFPYSYTKLGGFFKTALMIVFVDIVLGPLLVFIIYKKEKKFLSFDINVLLSIQIIAFIYGAYALYLKHPVYNVFVEDRFKLVNMSFISENSIRHESLKTSFFTQPKMAFTELPENTLERTQFMMNVDLFGKPDIHQRVDLYQPPSQAMHKILDKQLIPSILFNSNNSKSKLKEFIKKHGGAISDYAFFPISGNNKKEAVFVLRVKTAKPVGIIDIFPHQSKKRIINS